MFCVSFASGRSREQPLEAVGAAPVELAHVQRAPAADEDAARIEVVGAEVDERADRPLLADDRGDQRLVDTVLKRDDEPVGREPAARSRASAASVCCAFTASSTVPSSAGSSSGSTARACTVNSSTGPSSVRPFALIAATWSASASQNRT